MNPTRVTSHRHTEPVQEGVIQFELVHRHTPLVGLECDASRELGAWREILRRLQLIGQSDGRYHGLGFGNLSCRIPPWSGGARRFVITGSQTGRLDRLSTADYAVVDRCDGHRVVSHGETVPSSESTTHGVIYELAHHVRWVFHGHSPEIWNADEWPTTHASAGYGTAAMADEVRNLWRTSVLPEVRLLVMGGHEDGVISFGRSPDAALAPLVRALARSLR